jgi:hypothetical protein
VDPILGDTSNPQRLNRYGYVLNDPVNYIDPDGMQEIEPDYFIGSTHYLPIEINYWGNLFGWTNGFGGGFGTGWGLPSGPSLENVPALVPPRELVGVVGKGVERALVRLKDKNCADALGGAIAASTLRKLWNKDKIKWGTNVQTNRAEAVYIPSDFDGLAPCKDCILINRAGGYETGTNWILGTADDSVQNMAYLLGIQKGVGKGKIDLPEFQELLLLHELGHATGTLLDEEYNSSASITNSRKVWEACFE